VWGGNSNQECWGVTREGACWGFIDNRFLFLMYGFYDSESYWRPNLVGILFVVAMIPVLFRQLPGGAVSSIFLPFVFPWLAVSLLYGPLDMTTMESGVGVAMYVLAVIVGLGVGMYGRKNINLAVMLAGFSVAYIAAVALFLDWGFGLSQIGTDKFGGLMLTLILASVAIGVSMPLGIILALGRQNQKMPLIRTLCIGFIEIVRAVPLITVLFMAQFMLPLFLPEGVDFDNIVRAMVGMSLFAAAYMAEVVRGGLQAIGKGQYEAADALGLNYFLKMRFIIMPQALKIVIPGIVSTFIGLFKDTTLVVIIGLFDMLQTVISSLADTKWNGLEHEGYFFVGAIYFVFCFGMSRYSMYLERKLHTGHKR
jgi:general L-amino acid transport system permease protein